jgi:hypothetical protein
MEPVTSLLKLLEGLGSFFQPSNHSVVYTLLRLANQSFLYGIKAVKRTTQPTSPALACGMANIRSWTSQNSKGICFGHRDIAVAGGYVSCLYNYMTNKIGSSMI